MAPSRRMSNGRSPIVNQQSQITSFFTKKASSSSSSPSPSPVQAKQTPKHSPKSYPGSISPSQSPVTPSPLQSKRKKLPLVIGPSSAPSPDFSTAARTEKKSYGSEVVNKRIRVYWPLDQSWYDGCVVSFNSSSGKHMVQYDDADEELLDLALEQIELIEEPPKKFRRLRRISVVEDEEDEVEHGLKSSGDDSTDEDWGKDKGVEKEEVDDSSDDEVLAVNEKKHSGNKITSSKRKMTVGGKSRPNKKGKNGGDVVKLTAPSSSGKESHAIDNALLCDPLERFGTREAEKFRFLGVDRRDANKRRSNDVCYDPRTLYLPPEFLKSLTGGQRQWWEFKSKHMDKVLFFKMGKFYELFEMDAHVGARELDLQYMKGEQPHCGFPEKNFSINVEKLARKGYRVLVVEQTETPEQLELRRREQGCKDKVVKREICAVVTKGTLTEGEMLSTNPNDSYLMALTESSQTSTNGQGRIFGICMVDVATGKVILGQFEDDSECTALCSLLAELRPVEIIKPAKVLSPETEKVLLRHTRTPLINELVPQTEFWNAEKTICEVKGFYQNTKNHSVSSFLDEPIFHDTNHSVEDTAVDYLPDVLSELVKAGESGSYALSALGGTLFYLKKAFLDNNLLRFARYEILPSSGFGDITQKPYMVLDAAALENLEIFENNRNGDSSGTLYAQLNHCITAFGKRLLKRWLARPLYHLESIRERQDAIASLKGINLPSVLEFRKELSKLPDMERLVARVFASSEANGRNANKVVLYEDAAKKQLLEFISTLRGCEVMTNACSSLSFILENADSNRLLHLLTSGKGLPDIQSILKHFKGAFDWVEASNSGRIIPREGVDMEYDSACKTVQEVVSKLEKHLKEQRNILGDASIDYVTVGKDAYLLEVPESLCNSIPRNYELRSSKKGFFRYWTPSIKKFIGELSKAESEKESQLKSILQRLIECFCEHHFKWRQLVCTTAELDVLIGLAIASEYHEGPTCRPVFSHASYSDEVPCLTAKSLGHPVLRSDSLGKGSSFVTNDVTLGGSGHANFILLTGPNMGGKSTLLRQVCLAVILAQVGADVPAESFELSPVDCIFVRMGAKDHIMAGQSTFLTELLETASMLTTATRNSLVALDELGRGTSTSDGQAIAESVLRHFVHNVQCRGLFSTHYHRLAVGYQDDPQVSLCHMACQVGKGSGGLEEVIFFYRLTHGACPKSYGVNVARLAGLPETVLRKAAAKSQEFEGLYGGKRGEGPGEGKLPTRSWVKKMSSLVQDLTRVVNIDLLGSAGEVAGCSLNQLQISARTLIGQN